MKIKDKLISKNKTIVKNLVLVITLLLPFNLFSANFEPSEYASDSDSVFIETAVYEEMIKNLKSFFTSLKKGGEQEYNSFGQQIQFMLGINLLDINELKKIGVDVKSPMGFALKFKTVTPKTDLQKEIFDDWVLYLPAKNTALLYKSALTAVKKKTAPEPGQPKSAASLVKELKKNSIFSLKSPDEEIYFSKGKNFLVITNSKTKMASAVKKSSKPMANAPYYKRAKEFAYSSDKKSEIIFFMAMDPKQTSNLTENILKNLPMQAGAGAINPLAKENSENMLSSSMVFFGGKKGIGFLIESEYKDGFLDDMSKRTSKIMANSAPALSIDYYSRNLILYLAFKCNLLETLSLLKEMQPDIDKEMKSMSKSISPEGKYDIEKDLIPAFNGRFSLLLGEIPPEKLIEDSSKWKGYFSFGVNAKEKKGIENLMDIAIAKNKKKKDMSVIKSSYKKGTLYAIKKISQPKPSPAAKGKPQKPKTDEFFFYFNDKEAIFTTTKKNLDAVLNGKGKTVINRVNLLNGSDEKNHIAAFYINLDTLIQYLNTTNFKMMVAGFMPYLSNLSDFSMGAYRKNSSLEEIIYLRLKH